MQLKTMVHQGSYKKFYLFTSSLSPIVSYHIWNYIVMSVLIINYPSVFLYKPWFSILKAISTINMIEAYSDLHALRFILHIFFFAYSTQIMSQQTSGSSDCLIPAQLSLIPGTALPYPKHSSFLSRTQLFLIPDTALSYPAQLFHIWRTALLYPVHKICRSCVWD